MHMAVAASMEGGGAHLCTWLAASMEGGGASRLKVMVLYG